MKSMSGIKIPWRVNQQKMHEPAKGIQSFRLGDTEVINFDVWHTQQVHPH